MTWIQRVHTMQNKKAIKRKYWGEAFLLKIGLFLVLFFILPRNSLQEETILAPKTILPLKRRKRFWQEMYSYTIIKNSSSWKVSRHLVVHSWWYLASTWADLLNGRFDDFSAFSRTLTGRADEAVSFSWQRGVTVRLYDCNQTRVSGAP